VGIAHCRHLRWQGTDPHISHLGHEMSSKLSYRPNEWRFSGIAFGSKDFSLFAFDRGLAESKTKTQFKTQTKPAQTEVCAIARRMKRAKFRQERPHAWIAT
jgi:hypothetical protein